jgi:hypothetical protein
LVVNIPSPNSLEGKGGSVWPVLIKVDVERRGSAGGGDVWGLRKFVGKPILERMR